MTSANAPDSERPAAPPTHAGHLRRALTGFFPITAWLSTYSRAWLRGDLIAGATLVGLAVPESLGYAQIAGVPVQLGLYALFGGLIGYALFGSSGQLVVGPSAALAAISAALIGDLASGGSAKYLALTVGLTLVTGVVALLSGLLRLGFIARFISEPVLTGFIFGLAATIVMRQLPKLFGVAGSEGNFFERLWSLLTHLGDTNGWTLTIGAASLAILVALRRFAPRIPGALVALVFGILMVTLFGLVRHDVAIVGVIPGGLPQIGFPAVSLADIGDLFVGALGLTLVAYAEQIGAASTFAAKHHEEINPNQELIGLGVANLGAGLFQSFVVGGSLSKTAANDDAGARTQVSGLTAAALTLLTMLLLMPLFQNLPEATLGAVIIIAVWGLMNISALQRYWRLRRIDFALALTALLGELVFDVLPGLILAVALSLLLMIIHASRPQLSVLGRAPGRIEFEDARRSPDVHPIRGVLLLRPDEAIFFANAAALREQILALAHATTPPTHTVIVDLEATSELDVPGVDMLRDLCEDLRREEISLWLVRAHHTVRAMLDRSGVTAQIGAEQISPRMLNAVWDSLEAAGAVGAEELQALRVAAQRQLEEEGNTGGQHLDGATEAPADTDMHTQMP